MTPETFKPPWMTGYLKDFSIVGMNHYHVNGGRYVFVAMAQGSKLIKEEGKDDVYLWNRLANKALEIGE